LAIRFGNLGAVQPEVDRLEEALCRMSSADGLEPVKLLIRALMVDLVDA
jgi:hypothetical protein